MVRGTGENDMAKNASLQPGGGKKDTREHFSLYRSDKYPPDIRLTVLLVLVARRWRSLLDERLRPTGQSSARMEALSAIFNSPGPRPQVEIANRLRIEGPTLTRMIDTLEKDGLVDRLPDPADRRTKQLRLTHDGESALEDILTVVEQHRARLLDGVDPKTIAAVNDFLTHLLERLDTGLPGEQG